MHYCEPVNTYVVHTKTFYEVEEKLFVLSTLSYLLESVNDEARSSKGSDILNLSFDLDSLSISIDL